MVELQILCKLLKEKSISFLTLNAITEEYFLTYRKEYDFIINHHREFNTVPDKETFLAKFPNVEYIDVNESSRYLVDTINEEHLYALTVPVLTKIAELMQTDSRSAVEYLRSQIPLLTQSDFVQGTDIIQDAVKRYDVWVDRKLNPTQFCIPTGFPELDEIVNGWQRGEDLIVLFARTNQGKTWILLKCLEHAHRCGYRVGLIEPEMSDVKTGYRFDTLRFNVPNSSLTRGKDIEEYEARIKELSQHDVPFIVAGPRDFKRRITVSKLRSFIESARIDILAIDGISYLEDERAQRGENRTTALTHISEDLMDLSNELKIPILVVAQSNREGAKEEDAPDLENIRDSDGIGFNASVVIAIKQRGPGVELCVRKNRNGPVGGKPTYLWNIDLGEFRYIPDDSSSADSHKASQVRDEFDKGHEVF